MANGNLGQLGEILKGLVRLGGQGGESIQKVSKFAPGGSGFAEKGLELITKIIAQASTIPAQQDLAKSTEGTAQQAAAQKEELSPADQLTKSTFDEVIKINKEQVREASESGQSLTKIINRQEELDSNKSPKQGSQQEQGLSLLRKLGISLGSGLAAAGGNPNLAPALLKLVNDEQSNQNKLGGREKLQIQHKNAIELQELKAGLKSGGVDALSSESAIKFSMINTGSQSLAKAAKLLESTPNLLTTGNLPGVFKSQIGRQYRTLLGDAFEAKLRAVSGALISEEEIKKQRQDFEAKMTDNPETIRTRFATLNSFFKGTLNTVDPTGIHRKRASGQQPEGSSFQVGEFQVRTN